MGVTTSSNSAVTYDVVATQTLNSTSSTITFSSIPQTYQNLILVVFTRTDNGNFKINVNSDTGSNYSATFMRGNGTSVSSSRTTNQTAYIPDTPSGSDKGLGIFQFQNYSNTTTYKTILNRSGDVIPQITASVALWRSTSAISTITLTQPNAGQPFASGSTFAIYGIKAA